jgi:competence protein ComEC
MDYIQQKLALIDAQRAGLKPHSVLARIAPLFWPAVGLMGGIVLQERLSQWHGSPSSAVLIWIWVAILGLCGVAVWIAFARGLHTVDPGVFVCRASICCLCLGAIRLLAFETPAADDVRGLVGEEPRLATIRGRILTQPYQQLQDWCFAAFANADPSTAFYLEAESIKTPTAWHRLAGTIRVRVDEPAPNLGIGDHIEAYCWLHRFEEPTNPGQFDVLTYLKRNNVYVGASVPSRDAIEVQAGEDLGLLMTLRRRLTDAASRGLLENAPSDTQDAAMLQALLLGERRNIDRDTYEAFRKTGLAHIISLSGMNLAILVGAIWWFSRLVGLSRRARAVVCIVATAAFLLVVPPMAPILRAAVIVWVYCLAVMLRRHVNPLNSLSLAAILLLLIRPTQLFEAGWQLSFSAVAGILAFTTRIEYFIHDHTGGWFYGAGGQSGPWTRFARSTGMQAIRLFAAGTAAWLGNAGVLLYHFYTVTPLASIWTVLATLPVTAILILGFLKILVSWLLPTLGIILTVVLSILTDLFIWIVRLAAAIDFSSTLMGHVPLALVLLYYILILFAAFVAFRRPILKRALCAGMTMVLLGSLGVMKWQRTHRDHLSLTCLNVGHGQAVLVQLPGTMNILFDAGSMDMSDAGTRAVLPYLDFIGINHLHAIILSHHDIDHINGVPEVVDLRRIGHVYADGPFLTRADSVETARFLLEHLEMEGVRVDQVPQSLPFGPTRIEALWPAGDFAPQQQLGENDTALVCLIEFGGRRVLLCSDIEKFAQQQIMSRHPDLKADVVVVPHHGSVRTLDDRFLAQLGARILLCSCGRQDFNRGRVIGDQQLRSKNQAPESAGREPASHAPPTRLYLTARDGAVTICIGRGGVVKIQAYGSRARDDSPAK